MWLSEPLRFFLRRLKPKELTRHKFYRPRDAIQPLSLPSDLELNRVARWWALKPWEFRALDGEQQAELHATYTVEQEVEYYYSSEQARKVDTPTNTLPGRR